MQIYGHTVRAGQKVAVARVSRFLIPLVQPARKRLGGPARAVQKPFPVAVILRDSPAVMGMRMGKGYEWGKDETEENN